MLKRKNKKPWSKSIIDRYGIDLKRIGKSKKETIKEKTITDKGGVMADSKISYEEYSTAIEKARGEVSQDVHDWVRRGFIKVYVPEIVEKPGIAPEGCHIKATVLTFAVHRLRVNNRGDIGFSLDWIG